MGVLPSACAAAGVEKLVPLATPALHNIRRTRFSFRAPFAPQEQRRRISLNRGSLEVRSSKNNNAMGGLDEKPTTAPRNVASQATKIVMASTKAEVEAVPRSFKGLTRLKRQARGSMWVANKEFQRNNKALNMAIVSAVVIGAAYKLGTVDVGHQYAKHWTTWQYLLHLPKGNLAAYLKSVQHDPVLTKALTSCTAYGIGDFLAQFVQGRKIEDVKLTRVGRSALAGLLIHGPLCHYWIEFMEANLDFNGAWYSTPAKVFADQTVWSVCLNTLYTSFILSLQGKSPTQVKQEVGDTWYKALSAGWKLWPFVHMLTFSPLIPVEYKLLFVDCVEIIWVMILSQTVNQDSKEKERLQCNIEDFAKPNQEMLMNRETEAEVCLQDASGEMVCFVPGQGPPQLEQKLHAE
mmetsp:Transcript_37395/g.62947  ORF Transcript_37395/g.62947 Transcript_37395/m.62947 type:complete len:406 (-) Transcript_37395:562-1779(-)|eukprot:CAMPEP_0198212258 /NCGR_PEP_ID=MMETSP1445-20131203/25611_1 /TAXON_ID=36898 /ORGANISM="Pyramimonas sp., Strain CCMP2087" /LENGTH=405 /DNA_ID=CAMNT_0043886667 /DNA_START=206 /DNA_END=1423 /DNA_ORIENTATION=+